MTADETFELLKQFFEKRPVVAVALAPVHNNCEIGLEVGGVPMALKKSDSNNWELHRREAREADIVFSFDPLTAQRLAQNTTEDIGEWGVNIFREILAGHIRARFPGSIWNILRRGYVNVILSGGSKLRSWLAQNGYTDITKVLRHLKKN